MASGGLKQPSKIFGTAKGMTMKFLPDVGVMLAQNQENNLSDQNPKKNDFWKCNF